MKNVIFTVSLSFFSTMAMADKSYIDIEKDPLLKKIWNGFVAAYDEKRENKYYDVTGKFFKKGTVEPKAMRSLVKGRLPAYVACYKFVEHVGYTGSELKSNICVYYLMNPQRDMYAVQWRGNISDFSSYMSEDGFVLNGK